MYRIWLQRNSVFFSFFTFSFEGPNVQVELLWIYGADAAQLNAVDLTPSQVAKLENHVSIVLHITEMLFENNFSKLTQAERYVLDGSIYQDLDIL